MVTYLNCMALALGISAGLSSAPRLGTPFTNTKSLSFDGTDDVVDTGFQPDFIHTNATMAYWVNMDDFTSNQNCGTHNSKRFYLGFSSSKAAMGVQNANNLGSGADLSAYIAVGQWHHIAMVADGGTATYYLDGVARDTLSYTQNSASNPSGNIFVGAMSHSSTAHFMNGSIDEFAMWSSALTSDEVAALYNAGVPTDLTKNSGAYVSSSNLQAYYRMGDATLPAPDGTSNFIFDQVDTSLGSELIANGSFDGVADGTDPVGNVSNYFAYGSPTTRQITGGQLQLTTDGSNEGVRLNVPSLTAGVAYQIQMDISGDGSDIGAAVYISGGGNNQVPARTNGKIDTIFAPSTANIYLYLRAGDNTAGTTFYDNISVKQLNGKTATISGATIQTDTP